MIDDEKMNISPHKHLQHLHNIHYREHGKAKVTIQHAREGDDSSGMNDINLDSGTTSRHISSTIMSNLNRQHARE